MKSELILTNARIVTRDEVISGRLAIRDGMIANIEAGNSMLPSALDCEGDYLIPGLIELHTDNLEKHMKPRPGVKWPAIPATVAHDAQVVAAGITTVLDAIALGEVMDGTQRVAMLEAMMDAVNATRERGMLRADHLLHLRCELVYPDLLGIWDKFRTDPNLKLVSLMDHSPGQRQFAKMEKYREYYQGKYGLNDTEMEAFTEKQLANAARYSDKHRRHIVDACQQAGLPMASHDDATVEHALESAGFGMALAEFPTTVEAAQVSKQQGMQVMMGAPNVVRGYSHSGNVSARELAAQNLVDVLSSDYVPGALLLSAFMLEELYDHISLAQAIAMVSCHAADAIGLDDRGELKAGKRADVVQVRKYQDIPPFVMNVWKQGEVIF